MKCRLILLFLFVSMNWVGASVNEDPEKIIQVSISELFPIKTKKIQKKPVSPEASISAEYAKKVIQILELNRPKFMECLDGEKIEQAELKTKVLIQSDGSVNKVNLENKITKVFEYCLSEKMAQIQFPKHSIREGVYLTLPIILGQNKL